MQKFISKSVNVKINLSYTETCNLLKGGVIHTDIHPADLIAHRCLDDIEENNVENLQICIRLDEGAVKQLEFMKGYLEHREKHENKSS